MVDFKLVVVVDSELYVILAPFGSLVLVGTLVDLILLQVLHSTDIRYVLHGHVCVYACKKLMDGHPCIKTMDQLLNHNIMYRPQNHNILLQMLASSSLDYHTQFGSMAVSQEALLIMVNFIDLSFFHSNKSPMNWWMYNR